MGNICGIYAFSYVFALYDPVNFARGVASFYITGQVEIKELNVQVEEKLRKAKTIH